MHFLIFLHIACSLFCVKDPDELFSGTDTEPYVVEADKVKLDETEKGRISHLLGNVKITSRTGQHGILNGILV